MKYFVVSDIHSFFDEFKKAIDEAGFDPKDENHTLVICGDLFDRGRQPIELIRYLNHEVPRKILIRGNHEDLFEDMCRRGEPWMHDYSNGTCQTAFDLTGVNEPISFERRASIALVKITPLLNQMVDYYETEHYIFVHGWIPCWDRGASRYVMENAFIYNSEWRGLSTRDWKQARWRNGIDCAKHGVIEPNKTIICGHWHCSYGHWLDNPDKYSSSIGEDSNFEPYYADGIIAIDACTAYSGKVNCIVIDD